MLIDIEIPIFLKSKIKNFRVTHIVHTYRKPTLDWLLGWSLFAYIIYRESRGIALAAALLPAAVPCNHNGDREK